MYNNNYNDENDVGKINYTHIRILVMIKLN